MGKDKQEIYNVIIYLKPSKSCPPLPERQREYPALFGQTFGSSFVFGAVDFVIRVPILFYELILSVMPYLQLKVRLSCWQIDFVGGAKLVANSDRRRSGGWQCNYKWRSLGLAEVERDNHYYRSPCPVQSIDRKDNRRTCFLDFHAC